MLSGRTVIEVPTMASKGRVWIIRFAGSHGFTLVQGVRLAGRWLTIGAWGSAEPHESLRDARRFLFRGNGRLTGGHPEITDPVAGRMSRVHVLALASPRTVPGCGEYWG